jgi:fatty-acyl-CoA synthase
MNPSPQNNNEPLTEAYWPADRLPADPMVSADLTVGDLLRRAAGMYGDRVALVEGAPDPADRRRWTYSELLADAELTARALTRRFSPGEHIAVWAPNVPEWLLLEFGAALAGLVLVTVNPALKPEEVGYVLRRSNAAGLFLLREFRGNPMAQTADQLRGELPDLREVVELDRWEDFVAGVDPASELPTVNPHQPAQIQFTSGTTGFPKGATLAHRSIVGNARLVTQRLQVRPEHPVWVNPMPLFHTGGCVLGALGALWLGATHVLPVQFDPALVLELVEAEAADLCSGVPTMLIALMDHPSRAERRLDTLDRVVAGGALVPAPLVERIEKELGVRFTNVFGQTECSPVATMVDPHDSLLDKATTVGRSLPHVETKVIDTATGETVGIGVTGEFCTRGFHVMIGYHGDPEATGATIDADGWLHTGDLCSMDERGYVTVEGRLKDMIIRGGENIYPREIENVLMAHPGIAGVAVVGLPDAYWGEVVAAFLMAHPGEAPTEAELRSWCGEHLARHKVPVRWEFVDAWPLTGSGKIQKFVLRDRAVGGAT